MSVGGLLVVRVFAFSLILACVVGRVESGPRLSRGHSSAERVPPRPARLIVGVEVLPATGSMPVLKDNHGVVTQSLKVRVVKVFEGSASSATETLFVHFSPRILSALDQSLKLRQGIARPGTRLLLRLEPQLSRDEDSDRTRLCYEWRVVGSNCGWRFWADGYEASYLDSIRREDEMLKRLSSGRPSRDARHREREK